jgi:predicted enzyme related to lactoylglutathione lyase
VAPCDASPALGPGTRGQAEQLGRGAQRLAAGLVQLAAALEHIAQEGGVLLYLGVEGRLRDAVVQVRAHGGEVLEDVHPIGPHGHRALVRDSEGNRIALHSSTDS